jgi:hypothetical protein
LVTTGAMAMPERWTTTLKLMMLRCKRD